jgi:hypothetical protein
MPVILSAHTVLAFSFTHAIRIKSGKTKGSRVMGAASSSIFGILSDTARLQLAFVGRSHASEDIRKPRVISNGPLFNHVPLQILKVAV